MQQARRLMGNDSDAQDLAHDTLERALRARERFAPGTNMRAWLYTIMVRRAHDQFRRRRVLTFSPLQDEDMPASPPDDDAPPVWCSITQTQLRDAVEKLGPRLRDVFELHEVHNLQYQQIATRLGIPINTVASRLRRAREKLKVLLSKSLPPDRAS